MRDQVARNIQVAMRIAGLENPNQLGVLMEDQLSLQQIRNILNAKSGASVDTLKFLSEALNIWPPFLVASDQVTNVVASGSASPAEITRLLYLFCGTTDEGRKILLDTAEILPQSQDS